MSTVERIANLVVRQALNTAAATTPAEEAPPPPCSADNDYDGRLGVRISAIFVILLGSTLGACFPVFAARHRGVKVPELAFFIAKYFGSGVIIATAFIHLLAPANEALTDPCLTGPITDYSWVEGIALMTVFVLFFVELMAMRFATFGYSPTRDGENGLPSQHDLKARTSPHPSLSRANHTPGNDHLSHTRDHPDHSDQTRNPSVTSTTATAAAPGAGAAAYMYQGNTMNELEDYAAQMTAIFILEFGVIFHSIFIGLTLAVSGSEFKTLYVVLVFHQTFEGLGLGSRLASTPWPKARQWTAYVFAVSYGLSTPIAIAVGLGVRRSYSPGTQTSLIVNGVFDSISAGILIYTGLVELMAHEFMFSTYMRRAELKVVLSAFGVMCLGAGLMALLGKWA
ncbi:MAG: hypothetical protein Q9163_004137 [Psora crenata]